MTFGKTKGCQYPMAGPWHALEFINVMSLCIYCQLSYCIFLADFKAKGQSQGGAAKETDDSSKETQVKMPVTDTPSQGRT